MRIRSPLLRLVPAMGIFSLPLCDWCTYVCAVCASDHLALEESAGAGEACELMVEELLVLLMHVVGERACCGLSESETMRRELVQVSDRKRRVATESDA